MSDTGSCGQLVVIIPVNFSVVCRQKLFLVQQHLLDFLCSKFLQRDWLQQLGHNWYRFCTFVDEGCIGVGQRRILERNLSPSRLQRITVWQTCQHYGNQTQNMATVYQSCWKHSKHGHTHLSWRPFRLWTRPKA